MRPLIKNTYQLYKFGYKKPLGYFKYGLLYRFSVLPWLLLISPFVIFAFICIPFGKYWEWYTDGPSFLQIPESKWHKKIEKKYNKMHNDGHKAYRKWKARNEHEKMTNGGS